MAAQKTWYAGETVRARVHDVYDASDPTTLLTSLDTVSIDLYDATDALVATGTVVHATGDDEWYADLTAPNTVGVYTVKVSATSGSLGWKTTAKFAVVAF